MCGDDSVCGDDGEFTEMMMMMIGVMVILVMIVIGVMLLSMVTKVYCG